MEKIFFRDISTGQETFPIGLVNEVDSSLPLPFTYHSYNFSCNEEIEDQMEMFFEGCKCTICDDVCPCLRKLGKMYDCDGRVLLNFCDGYEQPIMECCINCKCSKSCAKKVVQRGIRFLLQVFKTTEKGFGVRTTETIPPFRFVCEYAGEVITNTEASYRWSKQKDCDSNFIFVLTEHLADGQIIRSNVDPTSVGNVGRFLNHSCEPNLFMLPVRTGTIIPRLCLFSARTINPLEELCYDYSGNWKPEVEGLTMSNSGEEKYKNSSKICNCESKNCSGFLPQNQL